MAEEAPMPLDFLRLCIEKRVKIQTIDGPELIGTLHAYDEHCNAVLSDVTENLIAFIDDEKSVVNSRSLDLIFVRGDRIVVISLVE